MCWRIGRLFLLFHYPKERRKVGNKSRLCSFLSQHLPSPCVHALICRFFRKTSRSPLTAASRWWRFGLFGCLRGQIESEEPIDGAVVMNRTFWHRSYLGDRPARSIDGQSAAIDFEVQLSCRCRGILAVNADRFNLERLQL
jgi:hypothetical protein